MNTLASRFMLGRLAIPTQSHVSKTFRSIPALSSAVNTSLFYRSFSASPLTLGQARLRKPAPNFTAKAVVNKQFKDVSLSDYAGKWVVLFFYPLDFTFVCPTEIIAFSERVNEFKAVGAEVVGVSVDSHYSHLAWINTPRREGGLGEMNIPLVSDIKKTISQSYGVLLEEDGWASRGTFIIDPKGILRQVTINDLSVGRNIDETLRLLEAFQFADKHGEKCPVGWTKGERTINEGRSKDYFRAVNKE